MDVRLNFQVLIKIFEDLPIGIGIFRILDLNDIKSIQYVYMNKVILYEMRKTREEVFGNKVIDVAPEAYEHEGGLAVLETYRKVATDHQDVNLGLVEYSNDMVKGTYECSVHHIQDNYVYVMLRNVTDLEQTKLELESQKDSLEKANNGIKTLIGHISHDLRSPILGIQGLANLLQEEVPEEQNTISAIHKACDKSLSLISTILDKSALEFGKVSLDIKDATLEPIIMDRINIVSKLFDATIPEENIQIDPRFIAPVDALRVEKVFENLLSNAFKYATPIEDIRVKLSENGVFSIENPISNEKLDKEYSTDIKGSVGFGLEIIQSILDAHQFKYEFHKENSFYRTTIHFSSSENQ